MATTASLESIEEDMKKQIEEIEEAKDEIKKLEKEEEYLQTEQKRLNEEISKLHSEIEKFEEVDSQDSSSRDARKMYGDMTPGDITHQDVILQYTNHFKDAFRNMPKALPQHDKYKVWQMCADTVEKCFKENRESVITTMVNCLEKALTDEVDYLTEETIDLHRAFKMLINDMKREDWEVIKKQVVCKDDRHNDDVFDWVIDVIMNLDPSDYICFIKTGEVMKKKVQLPKTEKKEMRTAESVKEKICPACKGKVKEKSSEAPQYHLGQYWHRHHMYCATCGGMLQGLDQFRFYDNHTYCVNCLCKVCGKPIKDKSNAVMTEIGRLHMSCFRCHRCHRYNEKMLKVNNELLCQHCYKPY